MATTSEVDIVARNSIKEGLNPFYRLFESTSTNLGVAASSNTVQDVFSAIAAPIAKTLVLELIMALLIQPAVRALPSRNGHGTLLRDLSTYIIVIDSNEFELQLAIPLVELVVNRAPDVEILSAVFELVVHANPKPITPTTVLNSAIFDTPLRSCSASQGGIEQTHNDVDPRILEELSGRIYYDVEGFFERYFEGKPWTNNTKDIYERLESQLKDGRWIGWPEPSIQDSFFEWFMKLQDIVLEGLHRRYYTSANKVLRGSEVDRKLDIFLGPADMALPNIEHHWSNVHVIGEHKQNADEDGSIKILVQIAGYARKVFGSQPDRRFVPGFTICGSLMRLWVFDRSGLYNSKKFDIHKEPERFIKVIFGYALMTDAELGLNTFIKHHETGKYIVAQNERIFLEDKPIALTKAIVCRGTTCFRGRRAESTDWECVVKFAWPSDKRQREGRLLKLAKDRGVTGIAELIDHNQVSIDGNPDTILYLRRGMKFGAPRKLPGKAFGVDTITESSLGSSRTRNSALGKSRSSAGRLAGLGITRRSTSLLSAGQKRKRDKQSTSEIGTIKRSGSDNSQAVTGNAEPDAKEHGIHSIEVSEADSLAGCESETFGNRIHCCLVVSPAGRPLHAYRSVKEFLEVLRDAIAGHRSLLEDGKILHRDISENNIIITERASEEEPKGRLIDLDLAKELNSMPSGASHRTGTMQFMAIEVLQGKGHTYRHDLESFFYVFIWMCIRYGHDDEADSEKATISRPKTNNRRVRPSSTSLLRYWYTGDYNQIANSKIGHMVGFENITMEFSPEFYCLKDLAEELRNVLFRSRDLAPFTGTYKDRYIMYGGMINAFQKAINQLDKESGKSIGKD